MISAHLTQLSIFLWKQKHSSQCNKCGYSNAIYKSNIVTREGISNCLRLKNIACSISNDIQSNPKKPWSPTPQNITSLNDLCYRNLCNFVTWILSPNSSMDGDGVVRLSKSKSTKANKICQNIKELVPEAQPRLSQALLSLNMQFKTHRKAS